MKDSIRLFVAAALPPLLLGKLQEQTHPYAHPAVRMMPAQNLHLTLYFIGNVAARELESIKSRVAQVAGRQQRFTLLLSSIEPGPKPRHPRLVWARFAPHPAFEALSLDLAQALSPQPVTKLKAIPHITLARFRKDAPPPLHLPTLTSQEPLKLPVHEIALWQSVLGSPHPTYSILHRYPLR
ncbi:RNA 2',3'-cyclic phosphodiesterase [Pontibacter mangrovi]|uniref:RNA 2',3'-cyclic phosphodiesterase n=1 Tax=Pontibacter mangrovi TaxID=2589816 RepID=A0A501W9L6_9BACT|nr:RNA 2',3'-cyclic phosphodiesterase [Pontibacter mangrovi]TPE43507.1 RNA 2',3'-cyclic phosphodiesterase [Pontibacter mangrovi]